MWAGGEKEGRTLASVGIGAASTRGRSVKTMRSLEMCIFVMGEWIVGRIFDAELE